MESWDEALRELRAEYIVGARKKVEEATRLVAHLASDPRDRPALSDLMHRFHGLAGSGATYGFAQVSEIALSADRMCGELLAGGGGPGVAHLDRFRAQAASLLTLLDPALAEAASPPPTAVSSPVPDATARRVLVVGEDPAVMAALGPLLEREGFVAEHAATRADAALQARRLPAALVVDVGLAADPGYEVVRALRALPWGDAPPILMLSAGAAFLDKVEAIHSGADAFFERPLDGEKIVRRLQDLLERRASEPARVLSVEDDPSQAAFVRAVLESAGYEVFICADPRRFESSMASFRPDLVLMDLRLPGVSGHDLVRYVRQDERFASLPVILMTTDTQVEAEMETMRAGADDHLGKPVPPGLLLSAVAARLERARSLKASLSRDGLTRLLTHTALLDRAGEIVARKRRDVERDTAWVMVDLDDFKQVNDRHGHPTGDRVLAALAALLRRRLRQSDTVGRYGGEEFALLLDDLSAEDAARLVERLRAEFRALEFDAPGGTAFRVTFSAGIAMLEPDMGLERWRQAADDALYAAKQAGRDRVVVAPAPSP